MARMTPADVAEVLATIVDQMPHVRYGPRALDGFYDGLRDLERDAVFAAVRCVLRRAEFAPTVASIRDEVYRTGGIVSGEDAWGALLAQVKRGSRIVAINDNPLVVRAIEAVGGLGVIRTTEHPELLRKDFLQAYNAMRLQALSDPDVGAMLRMGNTDDEQRQLAGAGEAHRAAKAALGDGQHGFESSGSGAGGNARVPGQRGQRAG